MNRCVCAIFFKHSEAEGFTFFGTMKLPPFRLCETFFKVFLMFSKGPPFNFLIFCNSTNAKKHKVSLFSDISALRLLKFHFFVFRKIFGRLQTVSLFRNFATEWMLKNLKGPPFTVFGIVRIFQRNNFCLKIRFSQAQHAISDFSFLNIGVFSFRFFGTLRLFKILIFVFRNFFEVSKGSPSNFLIFTTEWMVQNLKESPILQFSAL